MKGVSVMQSNIFEWHFAIRGPPDTEFEVNIDQLPDSSRKT